jgi:hypothetical protein
MTLDAAPPHVGPESLRSLVTADQNIRMEAPMLFMVIERFENRDAKAVYTRLGRRAG